MSQTTTDPRQLPERHREELLSAMQAIVREKQWLCESDLTRLAREFDLSPAEIYGTASFYSFLDTQPRGKHVIRLCQTIACDMAGKQDILDAIERLLGIRPGQTSADGKFSLLTTNCMGWCHQGPAMLVNDEVHHSLTPEKAAEILLAYREKQD